LKKCRHKKSIKDDLRLLFMSYIAKNDDLVSVRARKHLPFGWGGTLKAGGGWSGAILRALEILSKAGVYIDE
jgi:hypothetical protein